MRCRILFRVMSSLNLFIELFVCDFFIVGFVWNRHFFGKWCEQNLNPCKIFICFDENSYCSYIIIGPLSHLHVMLINNNNKKAYQTINIMFHVSCVGQIKKKLFFSCSYRTFTQSYIISKSMLHLFMAYIGPKFHNLLMNNKKGTQYLQCKTYLKCLDFHYYYYYHVRTIDQTNQMKRVRNMSTMYDAITNKG